MTISEIRRIDPEGMYEAVCGFPDQWRDGRARALSRDLGDVRGDGFRGVVVLGMGGSAIGGDLLKSLCVDQARVPVVVSRSYSLPAWVGPDTVVIASSYSGNTEETLSGLDEALARSASVICITTGGAVEARAIGKDLPILRMPAGLQPRAALGYSLTALLTVSERLGVLLVGRRDWEEAFAVVEAQAAAFKNPSDSDNPAWALAKRLHGLFPVIYSSQQLEGANLRWRNQMHENGKTLAVGNLFPEMNHNEIMGWARGAEELRQLGVVVLRDREDHERTQRRMDVTRDLLQERAGCWEEIHSTGSSRLARLLSLLYMSDWVSLYLAIMHGVDPSPVGLISQLKAALAQS